MVKKQKYRKSPQHLDVARLTPKTTASLNRPKSSTAQTTNTGSAGGRITNDTLQKHRDQVLKQGRRFKYPFHKSKHRVAILSSLLAFLVLASVSLLTGYRLYMAESADIFTYRMTQVLPFPVARVDGSFVPYESYLFELRSAIHWQEKYGTTDLRSPDGKRQIEYLKRQALDKAMANTLAKRYAGKHNIVVDERKVDAAIKRAAAIGGDLNSILGDQYGFGQPEFRRLKRETLLRELVVVNMDTEAPKRAKKARLAIAAGQDFGAVAKQYSDQEQTKALGGDIGVVMKGSANLPESVSRYIFSAKEGATSGIIKEADRYYIIHINKIASTEQVGTSVIEVRSKSLYDYLADYVKRRLVNEYVTIDNSSSQKIR